MALPNNREYQYYAVEHQHLKLNELKQAALDFGLQSNYLYKTNIPLSPEPEFHVCRLKHDTTREGLIGIKCDGGFKYPFDGEDPLVWWSLSLGPEEITSAETRLLEKTFPDRTEEQVSEQQSFLWKFTSSPAFLHTSRLGSYRFTFPLEEVLSAYSHQFCSDAPPVMRVYRTMLFKQEVVHAVLVHSPDNQTFSQYPLLTDDPNAVCVYRDGCFIWRPEAMSKTHKYELNIKHDQQQMETFEVPDHYAQFYVWNHVAIALHVEKPQMLKFDDEKLRKHLQFCEVGPGSYIKRGETIDPFKVAEQVVSELWPDWSGPLEAELPLQQSFTGPQHPPGPGGSSAGLGPGLGSAEAGCLLTQDEEPRSNRTA